MPRYFFDIDDGLRFTSDELGQALPDRAAARHLAIAVLPPLARDVLPDGDRHAVSVVVRNEQGRRIFRAVLELVAEWLE
ncbi:DUF6894 family protein [Paracoccus litorisediminis]|uniref:DUF6894 domain-containing protein n=1 Tax=Paracoccus litorisediminis TaxID=2006130 RepID=A0A844HYB9_9RHOB|nr:hypothetical protein [Paracoccus litorisediminis]MTH62442.1 hypothetical protein [Paracoccus litorisediminis]